MFFMSKAKQKVLVVMLSLLMICSIVFGNLPGFREVKAEEANLVKNPGFEDGADKPTDWVPYLVSTSTLYENSMIWDSTDKHSGQKSLKLYATKSGQRCYYDQYINTYEAGEWYNFSAWYKMNGFKGSAIIQIYYTADNNSLINIFQKTLDNTKTAWTEYTDYKVLSFQAPTNNKPLLVRLVAIGKTGDSSATSVSFDDISLTKSNEKLDSIIINTPKQQLVSGQTENLTVSGKMDSGNLIPLSAPAASISYASDKPEIATVDSKTGKVTAVSPGIANITASVTAVGVTKTGSAAINVSKESLDIVNLSSEAQILNAGKTVGTSVYAALTDGTGIDLLDAKIVYSSANPEIATISNQGLVKGLKAGNTTVSAAVYYGNVVKTGSLDIQVLKPVLENAAVTSARTEILLDQTIQLTVAGSLTDGNTDLTGAAITYTSDKPEVATVSESGLVTGVKPGVAAIKADVTLDGVTKEAILYFTVTEQIKDETIIYDFHKLGLTGQETQDNWAITNANCGYIPYPTGIVVQSKAVGDYINLSFYAPQTSPYLIKLVGTITKYAALGSILIDGQNVGDFNFYNTEGDHSRKDGVQRTLGYIELPQGFHQLTIKVKSKQTDFSMYPTQFIMDKVQIIPELEHVVLGSDKAELILGQAAKITVSGIMNTGDAADLVNSGASISYKSDNQAVAAVSATGIVTPVAAGTANITASVTMGKVTKEATKQIIVSDQLLTSVTASAEKQQIPYGAGTKIIVNGVRTDGKAIDLSGDKKVFTSSNTEILTVSSNGAVAGIKTGKATVSVDVTIGSITKSASAEVEVVEPELDKVSLTAAYPAIALGSTAQLKLSATMNNGQPADLTVAGVTYKVDSESIITVTADGKVKAIAEGTAVVTASVTLKGVKKEATMSIEVQDAAKIKNAKQRATYYTEEKVAAAKQNVGKYDWAKALRDKAVLEAEKYTSISDEELWSLVTPQSIPRVMYYIQRTKTLLCPACGKDISQVAGPYPWTLNPLNQEDAWKLTCPSCKAKFPSNDFGAFYKSGLDEHGIFNHDLADKNLLKNTLYPDKGETWGVDDGNGWKDENGNVYAFIGYYNHWALWYGEQGSWGIIQKAVKALRDAYIYTGDVKYAHSGIILLDRIADVYPDMDIAAYLWKDGFDNGQPEVHTCQGKVLNDIWETFLAKDFSSAYDAFFPALKDGDAANVLPFLSGKGDQYGLGMLKYSVNGIKKNIEDNILRQVLPGVQNSQIRGNQGMHQSALAMAAVVLDEEVTTQQMLDFNFQPGGLDKIGGSQYPNGRKYIVTGGNVLGVLTNDVDRDGFGSESAPGYNYLWIGQMTDVADVLDGYDRYPKADMYRNPITAAKLAKMFKGTYPLIMAGEYIPSIGDSGGTGLAGLMFGPDVLAKAFQKFGTPEFAQAAYMLNGNSSIGLHGNIFSDDPDKIANDIQKVIDEIGPMKMESDNLTGYGLTVLRDGEDKSRKVGYEYDFLQMSIAGSSGKEYKEVSGPSLFYRSAGAGDFITFKFNVMETAEYDVRVKTMLASLYGKYIVKIDGKTIGDEYDPYAPQTKEGELKSFGMVILTAGEHQITLECTGKNDASSNYCIGLRQLALLNIKEAEEVEKNKDKYQDTQRDVWVYYGRNTGHGHKDTLNLGVHAFGIDLAPDLGYPDKMDNSAKRVWWTSNTISHNTVMVDKQKQKDSWVGVPENFDENDNVSLIDVDALKAYPQTDMYRRTTAQIKVDGINSYTVDFFRVSGGNDHHFSFHSNDATVSTEGLNMTAQPSGTYEGLDITYGVPPAGSQSGFSFLKDVERDSSPANEFSIDWQQKKDPSIHLRLTMLGKIDDASLAVGEPPLTNKSNPTELKYFIAHRQGQNLDSNFTSVIEPYKEDRYIESTSLASVKANGQPITDDMSVKAVKVILKNGRTDYIISSLNPDIVYTIDDKFQFKGTFGVYSEVDGKQEYSYLNGGEITTSFCKGDAAVTGTIIDFTKTQSSSNELKVKIDNVDFTPVDVVGRYVYVENDGIRNAAYRVKGVNKLPDGNMILDIGDATLIRGWADSADYSKGYAYDVSQGAKFTIPMSYYLDTIKPGDVKNTYARYSNNQLEVNWQDPEDKDLLGINIYDGTKLLKNVKRGEMKTVLTGLSSGTTYYIKITAVDTAGNESYGVRFTAVSGSESTESSPVIQKPEENLITRIDELIKKLDSKTPDQAVKDIVSIIKDAAAVKEKDKIAELVEKTIEKITKIDEKDMEKTETESTVSAQFKQESISKVLQYIASIEKELEGLKLDDVAKALKKKITIELKDSVKEEIKVGIPVEAIKALSQNGMDLEVQSGSVSFRLPVGAIGSEQLNAAGAGTYVQISSKEVKAEDAEKLTDKAGSSATENDRMNSASKVYEFNLDMVKGDNTTKVTEFNNKVSVEMPYDGSLVNTEKLGVYRYNPEKSIWEYAGGKVNKETGRISFTTAHFSMYAVMEYNRTFEDIKDHWAKADIELMAAKHIVKGKGEDIFEPESNITRAEFASMVIKALGIDLKKYKGSFGDITVDKWYADIVQTAAENDIIQGYDGSFRPEDTITREEMTVIMLRAYKLATGKTALAGDIEQFTDKGSISNWAVDAVRAARGLGLISGISVTEFAPVNNATRAETAVIIKRLLKCMQ